ncbi:glycosyltransferase family 2 protein [Mesorhizobium sp. M2D.F.Ca.ET.185.01.1.1]|uniref:glycosyltransferase family 2 protein n=1 Tax=unclassified Mesorhizobium TaxID=325217 RepID=UPI000FCA97E2|nr:MULTISPECIES: glycosyltransferase family 2 protein [unclassified Mesorhizobium]TGP76251.1 glycosyltransferase family 2 protein [bacterium M00.F.Ca.ET.227.01.1.1]TGP92304.1 glycosyltransferase family 2 protein [bacterium M00.F.Ca.ET.222.01.1.1]TGP96858.1 glycosyltransferase family 2 protein [bacterium M00.F.Ca.ET.221.01.1.1]TGT68993.1 glycosyltransferase family 2 protein [bacterium M00.F.Ca.ET.159.01.1.1]TGT80855.1 glycosyltransferase family 2 protein [bacterium M00.F.Ca.ET.157.01.1.1]TGU06
MAGKDQRVAVLMATKDGAAFIGEQLQSLLAQSWPRVDLWVSDDGSTDATTATVEAWRSCWNKGSLTLVEGPRKGFAANFRSMIIDPRIDADYYAFCDQDDVWEPDRLESAIRWMEGEDMETALLFCSRTATISETGVPAGYSPLFRRPPSFRNALVQSIAGGNTMLLNRKARDLLAKASARTEFVSHDWWAYLIVTAAAGKVRYEPRPLVRYRQHAANLVGANVSWKARLSRLGRLFKGQFATWTDSNLRGLAVNRDLIARDATLCLRLFIRARKGSTFRRFSLLGKSGVYRQTLMGTLGLYLAFLSRRI